MSNFVVSARKYRPQRFEDVVGQAHVAGTLKNALATDHVAHAFLFTGPRGVGKTTCARILAKILNCEKRTPAFEACNACSSCTALQENASFNIIELDAASNNSVEHIRALIEQVRFQPQQGRYKVFIIDEVHMLSNQAFNAFLKTLEEPPPYAIFILATTERHKIIPTILSRCQIFDFRRITVGDMVLHLRDICQKEGITAEDDALHIIAQKADGALRDALSIFDRITSSSKGRQITYNDVIENLNVLDYDYYFQATDALLAEDAPAVMNLFDQILRKGFEPDIFVNGLAEHLRNILVCKDAATLALLESGDSLRERYRKQASLAPASFLLTSLNLCNDCDINFKMARNKRLHVEMSLLKMCYISRSIAAAQEKKTPDLTPAALVPPPPAPNPTPVHPPRPVVASGNAHVLNPNELVELSASIQQGQRKAEVIPLSLDAYESAVLLEESKKASLKSLFDEENARKQWEIYASKVDSPSLRQAMTNAVLSIEDKMLIATVGMDLQKGLIQQEGARLGDFLRQHLQDPALKVRVDVDKSKAPETTVPKPARPMTPTERLERMKEQNPVVAALMQRFELRVDS